MIKFRDIDLDRVVHNGERVIAGVGAGIAAIELGRTISSILRGEGASDDNKGRVKRLGTLAAAVATVAGGIEGVSRGVTTARTPYEQLQADRASEAADLEAGADHESAAEATAEGV